MTDIDLGALEATARAATPGPWVLDNSGWSKSYDIPDRIAGGVTDDDWTNVIMPQDEQGGGSWSRDEDAKYIAAFDPTTALALIARLRTAENVVKDYDANFPCDGGCNVNDGPEETCSRHGRSPADLWNITEEQIKRANDAEARLREAETVIAEALGVVRSGSVPLGQSEARHWDRLLAESRRVLSAYKTTKTEGSER